MNKPPTIQEIIRNPREAHIPKSVVGRYAIARMLIEETKTAEQFAAVTQYILRKEFSSEYSIMVMCEVTRTRGSFLNTESFNHWAKNEKAAVVE